MSRQDKDEVTCPKCNTKQTITYWQSINVDLDPELKKDLFEGNLNKVKCENQNCDFSGHMGYPLLYHDMKKRFCVQYYPEELLSDPKRFAPTILGMTRDGKTRLPPNMPVDISKTTAGYIQEPHIVFDMAEMLRFIVFRDLTWEIHTPKEESA
jgi:hypothetical protein